MFAVLIIVLFVALYIYISREEDKLNKEARNKIVAKEHSINRAKDYISEMELKIETLTEDEIFKIDGLKHEIDDIEKIIKTNNNKDNDNQLKQFSHMKGMPTAFTPLGMFIGLIFGGPIGLTISLLGNYQYKKGIYVRDLELFYKVVLLITASIIIAIFISIIVFSSKLGGITSYGF